MKRGQKQKAKRKIKKLKLKAIPKPEPLVIPEPPKLEKPDSFAATDEVWRSYSPEKQQRIIQKISKPKIEIKKGLLTWLKGKHD